ncbi:hypothetical protein J5I95_22910 [Candidatus Poribacteria bacterium]|nr:hypothetical protein [Candidatus Poribacteria bacterium]
MAFGLPLFADCSVLWLARWLRHTEYAYYFNTPVARISLWVGQDARPTGRCAGYSTVFHRPCLLF